MLGIKQILDRFVRSERLSKCRNPDTPRVDNTINCMVIKGSLEGHNSNKFFKTHLYQIYSKLYRNLHLYIVYWWQIVSKLKRERAAANVLLAKTMTEYRMHVLKYGFKHIPPFC